MKVLVIGARGIPDVEGGAEKCAEHLFPLIAAKGPRVHLISLKGQGADKEFMGVKIIPTPSLKFLGTDKLFAYAFALCYAIYFRPDIVHLQGLGASLVLGIYRLLGFKIVARYGSYDYELDKWGPISSFFWRLCEWQLRWAHAVIAVTEALKDRLVDKGLGSRAHIIPNAIDGGAGYGIDGDALRARFGLEPGRYFLSVGRVTDQKNFIRLAEAFREAKDRLESRQKLVIVGGLEEKAYVDRLRAVLTDDIVLTGRLSRSEIFELHSHSTGYVSASIAEGHSNAILEAIGCETPLVLSDIDPNRDLNLAEAHYFNPDETGAIADALVALDTDRDRLRPDRAAFAAWTWADAASATHAIYETLLERRSRRDKDLAVPADR